MVAGPDPAGRRRRGVADLLAHQLPARPAPDQGEPGGTAHPGDRRRADRPRRRPRPGSHARTAAASATGMRGGPRRRRSSPRRACRPPRPACWPQASCSPWPGPQPPDPARAEPGRHPAATTTSAVTVGPARHAHPATRASRGLPGRRNALRGSGQCYRKTGTPVTITSAAVSPVSSFRPPPPPGQQQAVPVQYGFWITVPAADVPALHSSHHDGYRGPAPLSGPSHRQRRHLRSHHQRCRPDPWSSLASGHGSPAGSSTSLAQQESSSPASAPTGRVWLRRRKTSWFIPGAR